MALITDALGNTFETLAGYTQNRNGKIYQVLLKNPDGSNQLDAFSGFPQWDSAATAALQAADDPNAPPPNPPQP